MPIPSRKDSCGIINTLDDLECCRAMLDAHVSNLRLSHPILHRE